LQKSQLGFAFSLVGNFIVSEYAWRIIIKM
jgi:hypothetical protein